MYLFNPAFNPAVRDQLDEQRRNTFTEALQQKQAIQGAEAPTHENTVLAGIGGSAVLFTFSDLSLLASLALGFGGTLLVGHFMPGVVNSYSQYALGAGVGVVLAHNARVEEWAQFAAGGAGAFIAPRLISALSKHS